MTDLATSATEPPPPAAPARAGSAGSAWVKWLARRLGLAVLTLWLCSVLVFFATAALGDPVRAILGKDYAASPERAAALAAQLNLDQPVIVRYFDWLGGLLTGNLGTSIANGLPVGELVGDRIINSAVLVLASAIVMIPVAFGIAMISANYRGKRTDGVIQVVHDHPGRAAGVRRRHPAGGAVLHHRVPRAARGHDRGRRARRRGPTPRR